ncbi:MAG TPA: hypothetical protein VFN56_03505 [Candidatus Saccharimonadales bacterium]|nr:hypothetical protein [Candidatus Saccharimonadales bacterium]
MRNAKSWRTSLIIAVIVALASALLTGLHSTHSYTASTPHSLTPSTATSTSYAGATAPELATASCHMHGLLPDPICTPGSTNPAVTQATINQTICVPGYTKTIRPPASYTDQLKAQQMTEYDFTDSIHAHEEDHLISLELGGAPSDPKNLWPEPHASPNAKDMVEDTLHTAVCNNRLSLQAAQQRIATDWTTATQGL